MADRTVTTRLKLTVTDFVAGGSAAKRTLKDLNSQFSETAGFAAGFRKKLEDATKALPRIEIDADSSPADRKIAELRARLDTLSRAEIGVDVDAAQAMAEMQAIQRELESLDGNDVAFEVKAGVAQALSELRAIDAEMNRVDGRTASVEVNANVGSALSSIALVGAALAALPAATTIGVGVAGLGAAFTAAGIGAGAFAAVAVPGISRVSEAMKAAETASAGAGGAVGGAGKSAAQAAGEVLQLEQAEKRLKDAQNDAKAAQQDLTRAREDGRRALEDMNFSLDRSVLSQKDAALAVREAAVRLAEVNADPDSSQLERERAALSYEQAQQRVEEQEVKTARAIKDTATANKAGVKGTKEYQDGLNKVSEAQDKVSQAEAQLKQLHLQQAAAMSSGGGAAGGAANAFAKLSKQEKILAGDMKDFKDAYLAWQVSLQPDVFPVISQGLGLMQSTLPLLTPMVKSSSAAFSTLLADAKGALAGPFWGEFLFNVNTQIPTAIVGLGRSFGNITTGFAGVINAFLPFTPTIVGGVEDATAAFSKWGQELRDSPEFHEFILFVKTHAPEVWELIKNIASALGNVATSLMPLGIGSMAGLNLLAKLTADMSPETLQAIALGIIAIKAAQAGLKVASFFTEFGGMVDRTKTKAGEFGTKISGLTSGLGLLGTAVGGAALVGGLMVLESRLSDNARAATEFQQKISAMGGGNADAEIAAINKAIGELRGQIGFSILDTIYFSDAQRDAADKLEALEGRLGELKHAKEIDAIASQTASKAAGEHGKKVGELNTALDTFSGKTDALQAIRNMEQAYKDASSALDASNGKLEVNRRMTDEQRDAVITAREKFSGYIQSIKDAATGAETLSGKTSDGTKAVLEQLPKLSDLAGKSGEAKQQILLLAAAYGISATDAAKAMKGGKDLRDVLAELKSKSIKIDMDTATAQAQLNNLQRTLIDIARRAALGSVGGLNPTSAKGNAWGGIQFADGRPDYMAQGGIRNLGTNPSAMIATQPYMIPSRGGPNVIFGEAGAEAYIPLDSGKRGRGLQILQEAAGIMGMAVVPEQINAVSGGFGSVTSGGGGTAMVTVTGIEALRSSLDTTALDLTGSLGEATSTLDATLGDAGTLTTSLAGVGEIAGTLADEVTGWGEVISVEFPPLVTAVADLKEAVTSAAAAAKSTAGSKADEGNPRDSEPGYVAGAGPAKKSTSKNNASATKTMVPRNDASAVKTMRDLGPQPGYIEGYANGGITDRPSIFGEAGLEAAVPLGAGKRSQGLQVLGQAAQHLGASVNYSRQSRPVQGSYSGGFAGSASSGGSSASSSGSTSGPSGPPIVNIDMTGTVVREQADINRIGHRIGYELAVLA